MDDDNSPTKKAKRSFLELEREMFTGIDYWARWITIRMRMELVLIPMMVYMTQPSATQTKEHLHVGEYKEAMAKQDYIKSEGAKNSIATFAGATHFVCVDVLLAYAAAGLLNLLILLPLHFLLKVMFHWLESKILHRHHSLYNMGVRFLTELKSYGRDWR